MNYPDQTTNRRGNPTSTSPTADTSSSAGTTTDDQNDSKIHHPVVLQSKILKLFLLIFLGMITGFVIEKSKLYEPIQVRGQMIFKKTGIMKMILSSLSLGVFGLSILAMLPSTHYIFWRVCNKYFNNVSDKGLLSSLFGGLLMGIGMTLAGSGATISFIQAIAGVPNSVYCVIGVFVGTLIYGFIKPMIDKIVMTPQRSSTNPWAESTYFVTALPLVVMFGMCVFALEILVPWQYEIKKKDLLEGEFLTQKAWAPHFVGCVLGLLEAPFCLLLEEYICSLGAVTFIVALPFAGPLQSLSSFLGNRRTIYANAWQMIYLGGILLGAYMSVSLSQVYATSKGVSVYQALIGGVILAIGAHTSGGSLIDHGVSGMVFFSIVSFLSLVGMFAGGGCTALLLRHMKDITPAVEGPVLW